LHNSVPQVELSEQKHVAPAKPSTQPLTQIPSQIVQQPLTILRTVAAMLFIFDDVVANEPVTQSQRDVNCLYRLPLCMVMHLSNSGTSAS